ncbi:hypothetical protein DdX_12596 [Ditylenchus destructor]|uniref:Uncharacterized protein n=1 Tax=Ditylenchus destructor TaxID=166010 RepID=A0AAD4MVF1_9BILA|nr:hypothetical protein DdX_12596 [Ditylenchus destructor]
MNELKAFSDTLPSKTSHHSAERPAGNWTLGRPRVDPRVDNRQPKNSQSRSEIPALEVNLCMRERVVTGHHHRLPPSQAFAIACSHIPRQWTLPISTLLDMPPNLDSPGHCSRRPASPSLDSNGSLSPHLAQQLTGRKRQPHPVSALCPSG